MTYSEAINLKMRHVSGQPVDQEMLREALQVIALKRASVRTGLESSEVQELPADVVQQLSAPAQAMAAPCPAPAYRIPKLGDRQPAREPMRKPEYKCERCGGPRTGKNGRHCKDCHWTLWRQERDARKAAQPVAAAPAPVQPQPAPPNLHVIRDTSLRDIPATLRNIAADIEAGKHGAAIGCVVVLEADRLDVFYTGSGEAGPCAHLLLHAGAAKMLAAVIEAKV